VDTATANKIVPRKLQSVTGTDGVRAYSDDTPDGRVTLNGLI